jgi:hypothetical protein
VKRSNLLWSFCGAIIIVAGCSSADDTALGDPDAGGSIADDTDAQAGTPGSGGAGGGIGGGTGGGAGGGTSGDGGKSQGATDAGATSSKDAGTKTDAGGSGGGGVPTTCTQADGQVGCCDPSGVLYYCTAANALTKQTCTGGTVCGWSSKGYYDCVAAPAGADPSGTSPMACGGGGSSGGVDAGTSKDAGSAGGVTWTTIYNTVFGPSGTSTCAGSSCHTGSRSGFACGSTKTTCYNGFVSAGYITPGASASSSALVDPNQSPLCGTLGGNMPIGHSCVTAAQITTIKSWLAAGAPNN